MNNLSNRSVFEMPKKLGKYVFTLTGINLDKVDQKYGITSGGQRTVESTEEVTIPKNTTSLQQLDSDKTPEFISFLDESKRVRKCNLSMIDFKKGDIFTLAFDSSHNSIKSGFEDMMDCKRYKCYWDRNYIPEGISPIGCPIRFVPDKITKSYISEISRENYTINENVTRKRMEDVSSRNDKRLSVKPRKYYETDGIFCSFNCCMAFINDAENKSNSLYKHSKMLLLGMYNSILDKNDKKIIEIMPAPHWRTLKEYGGHLTIEEFRNSFNRTEYIDHGMISVARLFEDKVKI